MSFLAFYYFEKECVRFEEVLLLKFFEFEVLNWERDTYIWKEINSHFEVEQLTFLVQVLQIESVFSDISQEYENP